MRHNRNAAPVAVDKNGTQSNGKYTKNLVKWQVKKELFESGANYWLEPNDQLVLSRKEAFNE